MNQFNKSLPVSDYKKDITKIIDDHFNLADTRVDEIHEQYFSDIKTVFDRHWRNKKDIPYDIVTPLKYAYDYFTKKISPVKKIVEFPRSGKIKELEQIISEHLLDLPGLENKLKEYVQPFQDLFEQELSDILEEVPALQRGQFTDELKLQIDRLQTPVDGAREAAMFLVVGIIGKIYAGSFSGTIATGSAVGEAIYISQLSWFGTLWAHIFGAPAWVGWAGGFVGVLVALLVAPLLTPIFEIGMNRIRAKKILRTSINAAREKLKGNDKDAYDVAGKVAIYLQFLPDVIHVARKTAGMFR